MMIQVSDQHWVNPQYVVAVSVSGDDDTLVLTLADQPASGIVKPYYEVHGPWVDRVMEQLSLPLLQKK